MLTLAEFELQYRGSSFPTRIRTSDEKQYVLKMRGAGNGAQSLMQEFIVNRTAALLGFSVPDAQVIDIPHGYPWRFGTDEFDDILQKSFGTNLGIEFIANAEALTAIAPLAEDARAFEEMLALDSFFRNFDRTELSQNFLIDRNRRIWLIDHGSCQFITTQPTDLPLELPKNHLFAHLPVRESESLAKLIAFDYLAVLREIPAEWFAATEMHFEQLEKMLEKRKTAFVNHFYE
ncbi:MAG: hypothetical protein JSR44_08645 [Spirochaetes bacterium]|nr:hypothetical protein [Spirochaetota bacterium]